MSAHPRYTRRRPVGLRHHFSRSRSCSVEVMWKYFYLLAGCFLALAQSELPCEVTQTLNGTRYCLPSISASNCTHNWSTGSTVVSTNKAKNDEVVIHSSIDTLLTKSCYESVTHYRSCMSENEPVTATCNTSCPAALQTIRPSSSAHLNQEHGEGTPRGRFGVFLAVGVLLIVVVPFFVLYLQR